MKKIPSIFAIINSVLILGLILFLAFQATRKTAPTLTYIDNVVVFSNFNMAKELNQLHQNQLEVQKEKVDSLLRVIRNTAQGNVDEKLQQQFVVENNKLREMGEYFANEASQKVWTRLNGYVSDFGKAHNYKIILGTQGDGNIMYGEDSINITNQFLAYANKKYEGE